MDTLRTPVAVASLIAANAAPLAGVLILGWSPAPLLLLYLVDTFLSLGVVVLLVMAHVTGNARGRPLSGWKDWAKAMLGLAVLGAIMALPLALPVILVVGEDLGVSEAMRDDRFVVALVSQVALSGLAGVRQHRDLAMRDDDDRVLARRLFFLVARWIVVSVCVVTGAITLLGPQAGGFALVAIYAGASIYFELFPDRAERFVRGRDAKPIVWEGDLDGPGAGRAHAGAGGRAGAAQGGDVNDAGPPQGASVEGRR